MKLTPGKANLVDAAIKIFAEKGYANVNIEMLAESAGRSCACLYKHFRTKKEVLDVITELGEEQYAKGFGDEREPALIPDSLEEFTTQSMARIDFTLHNPMIRNMRRILIQEQFREPRISQLASKHFIHGLVALYTEIFEGMKQKGLLKDCDSQMMASFFVAAIGDRIHYIDREPEKEEAILEDIRRCIDFFLESYGVEQ